MPQYHLVSSDRFLPTDPRGSSKFRDCKNNTHLCELDYKFFPDKVNKKNQKRRIFSSARRPRPRERAENSASRSRDTGSKIALLSKQMCGLPVVTFILVLQSVLQNYRKESSTVCSDTL